ncbi:MAG TPA: FecR domain-containing protein [Terriglobales bacterium]|nr:FecR domain-containing protein [Terriglobales bacterium]
MKFLSKGALASFVLTAALIVPAWGINSDTTTAMPGTVNYVEGQASIGQETLNAKSVGSADLQAGQTLTTENGKAEILLTPGVYFRLGNDSSARMIAPDLTNTELQLNQGEAMVEVDEIHPQNDIRVREDGVSTRLLKTGLYDFDATNEQVRVFNGKASVLEGDKKITVKGGHELALNTTGKLKAKSFDKKEYAQNDDLYRWSSLRSDYLAQANVSTAQTYVADGWYGPGWFGAGWYWSPWFDSFTFIPSAGYFYNPFGWGFYSPLWVYAAPWYGYGNYYHHFATWRPEPAYRGGGVRAGARPGPVYGPGYRGGAVHSFGYGMHGFHGGTHTGFGPSMHAARGFGGFHAGGFHGGGFHGGGFAGGARR